MGTKKHDIVRKLTEFCAVRGYVIVEVSNRKVGDDAIDLLKDALNRPHPVSVKLMEIGGDEAFNLDLTVNKLERGIFTALGDTKEIKGKICRFPTKGFELSGKHIIFLDKTDSEEFTRLKQELYAQ